MASRIERFGKVNKHNLNPFTGLNMEMKVGNESELLAGAGVMLMKSVLVSEKIIRFSK